VGFHVTKSISIIVAFAALLFLTVSPFSSSLVLSKSSASSSSIGLKVLAKHQNAPFGLVVSGGYAYWTNSTSLDKVSIVGGGVPKILAGISVAGLDVYGSFVYYSNSTGVYRLSNSGGLSNQLVAFASCGFQCLAGNLKVYSTTAGVFVYFIEGQSIERVPISGGPASLLFNGTDYGFIWRYHLTISASIVYFEAVSGAIGKVSITGTGAEILTPGLPNCQDGGFALLSNIVVHGSFIYWTDNPGCQNIFYANVNKISVNGGPVFPLFVSSTGSTCVFCLHAQGLAYFNGALIFAYFDQNTGLPSGIYQITTSGKSLHKLISSSEPFSVAYYLGHIYFSDSSLETINQIVA